MTLKEKLFNAIFDNAWEFKTENVVPECEKIADDYAIAFYNWMRKNDTPENAEKFFHYTDKDMLNVFKEETGYV